MNPNSKINDQNYDLTFLLQLNLPVASGRSYFFFWSTSVPVEVARDKERILVKFDVHSLQLTNGEK